MHEAYTDSSDAEDNITSGNGNNGNGNGSHAQNGNGAKSTKEHHHGEPISGRRLKPVCEAPVTVAPCAHGLNDLFYYDEVTGQFGIAPQVEGRIIDIAPPIVVEAAVSLGTSSNSSSNAQRSL